MECKFYLVPELELPEQWLRLKALAHVLGRTPEGLLVEAVDEHIKRLVARHSLRECEEFERELRARAQHRYPHPSPDEYERIEAKIDRLLKDFSSQHTSNAGGRQAEGSGVSFESLPKRAKAAQKVANACRATATRSMA